MGALIGNLVVAIFGFTGAGLAVLFVVMAIAFLFKLVTGKQ